MLSSSHPTETLEKKGKAKMAYNPKDNERVNNYKKNHYKRLQIEFSKEYYTDVLLPVLEAKGIGASTFIREAVKEKIERESKK